MAAGQGQCEGVGRVGHDTYYGQPHCLQSTQECGDAELDGDLHSDPLSFADGPEFSARVTSFFGLAVTVEQDPIAILVGVEPREEPCHVGLVPFGRAGNGHGLHRLVLRIKLTCEFLGQVSDS